MPLLTPFSFRVIFPTELEHELNKSEVNKNKVCSM